MYIASSDETGDDGVVGSSPIFTLTAIYIHSTDWKVSFAQIQQFRKNLKEDFGLPVKTEMHTKKFILNKNPYRDFNISDEDRSLIITLFCQLVQQLPLKIINVIINKKKISSQNYNILDKAFTYSIQRLENDLKHLPNERFIIISDEGRLGKMRDTARKIQSFNPIPSRFNQEAYRNEIKLLVEDPLPKNSKESHFIQLADMVSFIVYSYCLIDLQVGQPHGRMPPNITHETITNWMNILKNVLNLKASPNHSYGVVCYPK